MNQTSGNSGLKEFIKFGLVGVMNTGVDFLVFTLLIWSGLHYMAAQPVSYGAGTLNSYIVNRLWTFRGRGTSSEGRSGIHKELLRFALLNAASLLLSMAVLYMLKDGLGLPALPSKLAVTGFTLVVNYIGSKLWVFKSGHADVQS